MSEERINLDEVDLGILGILQRDCRTRLNVIASKLEVPKSTIHYRIKRLESEGVIEGYFAKVNASKIGKDHLAITFVRAKYGPSYHRKVGQMLAEIPGVVAVYFVLGEMDFVAITRSTDREDFMRKLEKMTNMQDIERTSTQIVAERIKEDQRVQLSHESEFDQEQDRSLQQSRV